MLQLDDILQCNTQTERSEHEAQKNIMTLYGLSLYVIWMIMP